MLAQLDAIHATGVITTTLATPDPITNNGDTSAASDTVDIQSAVSTPVRFRFTPFPALGLATTPDPNTSNHPQR